MTYWAIFFASLMMGFSGAIMPGPLLTVTVDASLREGSLAGPKLILGHALLEFSLVVLIFFGLGVFLTWSSVKGVIGVIGGLFLLWMSYGMLKKSTHKDLAFNNPAGSRETKRLNLILTGLTVSASNPYWSIWWATVGAGALMLAAGNGVAGAASFYAGHIVSDFLWYSLVSTAVARGRRVFTPRLYRMVLIVCGVFLLGLALYFIHSGINFLRLH
ncbi:Lysine-type exporter protein (LYSE/YGGA) [Acididesulfobacillus acetoxydans]|uniref:LysE type translocator protein n=1 Tax=Acididesulfobacillus acetoxydans TaxID=1561005 RepID=A0A8S0WN35_9FIRM|nr:LysE family transporter [Acididesulfobacillus acetoxydans]CAA7600994.1 Lysine-type exporter protein (LYSE/YGGA) [Acididesulfobacillus acetoxydans]CEJ07717.1 LysE type translocator protein [Acididesulfobacillus acetoxydans]